MANLRTLSVSRDIMVDIIDLTLCESIRKTMLKIIELIAVQYYSANSCHH